jgi:cobalamin synthase
VDGPTESRSICYGGDTFMDGRSGRGVLVAAAVPAMFVLAILAVKALVTLAFYVIVGLIVIGGGMLLRRWARRALGGASGVRRPGRR